MSCLVFYEFYFSRVHSGDRPYSCPKCDVSFACISNLRRHRKQVHPTSPAPSENANGNEVKSSNEDKKPSLQIITSSVADSISSSSVVTMETPSYMASSSTLSTDTPVAIAAAMSGTVLTATGALVPANFLPASSIPGLILTSAAPGGALIAAPAHLTEQHSHLHPTIIAHNSGNFLFLYNLVLYFLIFHSCCFINTLQIDRLSDIHFLS
ncbi:unnamed protein product [Trichobilharzia regenti]|nr:unnamed protein product [Trichobilharzia regenti]